MDGWCPTYSDGEDDPAGPTGDDGVGGRAAEAVVKSPACEADGGGAGQKPPANSHEKDPPKASASAKKGAGARRTLKRRRSDGKPPQVEVVSRLCLWGQPLKSPVVVHPVSQDATGRSWTAVHEHLAWLRRACTPDGSSRYDELFQSAVSALRRHLKEGVSKHMASLAQSASSAEQCKARASLGLDDDDPGSEPETQAQRWGRAGRPPLSSAAELEVDVGGTRVCVKRTTRPLTVEVTMSSVKALIKYCRDHVSAGKATLRKHTASEKAEPAYSQPVSECPPIMHKVTWHPSVSAWCVHWKDAGGAAQVTRVRVSKAALPLGSAREARFVAYVKAIRMWNEEDKSTRERIEVPSTK